MLFMWYVKVFAKVKSPQRYKWVEMPSQKDIHEFCKRKIQHYKNSRMGGLIASLEISRSLK